MEKVFLALTIFARLLLPIACGAVIIRSIVGAPPERRRLWHNLTTISLGGGLGLGLLGCLFFLVVELDAGATYLYSLAEMALLAITAATYFFLGRRNLSTQHSIPDPVISDSTQVEPLRGEESKLEAVISVCFAVAVIAIALRGAHFWSNEPMGSWDAWSYWNCRALGIFRAGCDWKILLTSDAPFADYPMLIPSLIAGYWKMLGEDPLLVPRMISVYFSVSLYALMFSALAQMRGLREAKLGTTIILGTQVIARWIAAQTADGPYCFFLLSAVVAATSYALYRKNGYALLCGLFVGLAAFTKNEGLLFLAITSAVAGIWAFFHKAEINRRVIILFAVGLAAPLAMALWMKVTGSHEYIANSPIALYEKRTIVDVIKLCFFYGSDFGHWAWNPIPLIIGGILVAGWRVPKQLKPITASLFLSFGLTICVYGFVYLRRIPSYQDIEHNLDRLLGHWWPILLFLIFMILRRPGQEKETAPEEAAQPSKLTVG